MPKNGITICGFIPYDSIFIIIIIIIIIIINIIIIIIGVVVIVDIIIVVAFVDHLPLNRPIFVNRVSHYKIRRNV